VADREPVKNASVTVTLTVYGHVMPGDQKRAASRFARTRGRGIKRREVSEQYHGL
jgi:hypothetical protein